MGASKAKQYLLLGDKTILEHTIELFLRHSKIGQIVVVLHPQDATFKTLSISKHDRVSAVTGGDERVDSVLAGLKHVHTHIESDWVLVHDAARPCLDHNDVDKLIEKSTQSNGGILAVPVADTIKQANAHTNTIKATVDRSNLWQAQTPQMFPTLTLINVIEHALKEGVMITDEASAMEHSGHSVQLVEGQSSNIKVTRRADLALAQYYLTHKNLA